METNIQGVQGEVEKQAKKLEASLNSGFESLGGHIQELVKLLREQPQGMAIPAAIPVSRGCDRNWRRPLRREQLVLQQLALQ